MAVAEKVGSAYYDVDLDSKKLRKGVKESSSALKTLQNGFKAAERSSKILLGSIVGLGLGLLKFGFDSVKAYNTQARAEAELIQLHKENTGATEEQTRSLMKLASEVQNYGVVGDEAIIMGQAQLATFKMSTQAIKNLTPAMTDMVAKQKGVNATGDDFVNIGNLIGKVMEGNIGALGRYGVSFTKAQEKILKTGNEIERSAVLAEVLEQNYGGVNKALRDTPEGKLKSLSNRFGDLQEMVGKVILKAMDDFLDKLDGLLTEIEEAGGLIEWLTEKFEDNEEAIYIIAGAILFALTPAFVGLGISIASAVAPLLPFLILGGLIGLLVHGLSQQMGGLDKVLERVRDIFDKIAKVVEEHFLPPVSELHDIIKDELVPEFEKLWDVLGPELLPALKALAIIVGGALLIAFRNYVNLLIIAVRIIALVTGTIATLAATGKKRFGELKAFIRNLAGSIVNNFGAIQTILDLLRGRFIKVPVDIKSALRGVTEAIKAPFRAAFEWLGERLSKIKDSLMNLNPLQRHSPSLVDWIDRGTDEIIKQYDDMFSRLDSMAGTNRLNLMGQVNGDNASESSGNTYVTLELSGIVARSRGELREIGMDLVDAVNEGLRASGKKELGKDKIIAKPK